MLEELHFMVSCQNLVFINLDLLFIIIHHKLSNCTNCIHKGRHTKSKYTTMLISIIERIKIITV